MPNHEAIYAEKAHTYHEMVAKQSALLPYIEEIRSCVGLDVVDIGAGSGRLTVELAGRARSVAALDASAAMLQVAAERLSAAGQTNWTTRVADMRSPLPLADGCADLVTAGWSVCYVAHSGHQDWETQLDLVISEMRRVLRPGGAIVIIETMGTGYERPEPPAFLTAITSFWCIVTVSDIAGFAPITASIPSIRPSGWPDSSLATSWLTAFGAKGWSICPNARASGGFFRHDKHRQDAPGGHVTDMSS